ncbi:MAG: proton-conducting transporter membrane subunit, partial [Salinarimonas sp.]
MNGLLPVLIIATSLAPALATFFLQDDQAGWRNGLNLGGAVLKIALVGFMLVEVADGAIYDTRFDLAPGLALVLRVDALSLLFVTLSAALWLLTTIYAIAYLEGTRDLSRFFGFFSLCVAATTGIAFSGTLVTFFVFYELLTLSTWPLVVHKGDAASLSAGRRYLAYTMPGSAALLAAIVRLESAVGPVAFAEPAALDAVDETTLRLVFALFVFGIGVKAALVPLHGWLPAAMAAPAPVSALLHAVAVVKAGA